MIDKRVYAIDCVNLVKLTGNFKKHVCNCVILFVSEFEKKNCNTNCGVFLKIKVITKLPNSEQSYKGKVQTHNYINTDPVKLFWGL